MLGPIRRSRVRERERGSAGESEAVRLVRRSRGSHPTASLGVSGVYRNASRQRIPGPWKRKERRACSAPSRRLSSFTYAGRKNIPRFGSSINSVTSHSGRAVAYTRVGRDVVLPADFAAIPGFVYIMSAKIDQNRRKENNELIKPTLSRGNLSRGKG